MSPEIEYMTKELTTSHSGKLLNQLNELGKEGWELAAIISDAEGVFLREKKE